MISVGLKSEFEKEFVAKIQQLSSSNDYGDIVYGAEKALEWYLRSGHYGVISRAFMGFIIDTPIEDLKKLYNKEVA